MSVQNQINRINNEVSEQTELIEQITTALAGKAAGGGSGGSGGASVETCTVSVTLEAGGGSYATGSIKQDNDIVPYLLNTGGPYTFENVVCGSAIVVATHGITIPGARTTGGLELFNKVGGVFIFKAPIESGAVGTATIFNND